MFDLDSKEVLFQHDVQFDEHLPQMDSPSTTSPSLSNPPSSSLDDSLSLEDDADDDPPYPPPPGPHHFPRWSHVTIEVIGSLASDPIDTFHTHAQTFGTSILIHAILDDPQKFLEAIGHLEWDRAMDEEYSSLVKNHTWDLFPLPKGSKLVRCKWVYHNKYVVDGWIDRYKAHLVVKWFSQVEGIDYSKTFALVTKMNSIHLVLSLAASQGWSVF